MADDRDTPNKSSERAIFGFLKDYKDAGSWGECGYEVIEPSAKFANLSLSDVRRDTAKLSSSGADPFQGLPKRLKKKGD